MKNFLFFLILFLAGFMQLQAQNYFEQLGKITPEQIAMKSCSFDPTAGAVVLFDVGKSSFVRTENGYDVLFHRVTRIKILNESGISYAKVEIPFYQEGNIQEEVEITQAKTFTIVDGNLTKITTLDPKTCYEEKTSENWKVKKFAMPDVQPGSIIEYDYTILSQYHFNLRDWEFQWDIPVLYSAYEVWMIPFYEYAWIVQGRNSFDEYAAYKDESSFEKDFYGAKFHEMVYKFGLKNIPAFVDEEYSTSREDDIIKLDFQLSAVTHTDGVKINIMTTWPQLVNDYLKNDDFGRYIKKSRNSASKILDPDSLNGKTQLQKFNFIVDYAKDNFKWNHENSQFANKSPSDLQKDKTGNSASINLWVVGALQEAGIEAYPVVVSSRQHGKIQSDYPFSSAFNSVVVCATVDDKLVLADATDPFCPTSKISIQYMNDKGLLIDKANMKWINLQSPAVSGLTTNIKIDSIGKELKAQIVVTAQDYEALTYRNKYADNQERMLSNLSKKMYQVEDSSLKFRYPLDRAHLYTYMYSLKKKSEIINNKIYIQPFLNEIFDENPLKQKIRSYPVDMTYSLHRLYHSEIVIPEGYKIEFLPESGSQNNELFGLEYSSSQNGKSIIVSFSYTFKKSVYSPKEYSSIKFFFDRVVKKGSEKIVLVRK
jgi:hypothetical protein